MSSSGGVPGDPLPSARRQRRAGFAWIWLAPLVAIVVVGWLAVRAIIERGPAITIAFRDAEGIQPRDTKIRHKDVDLGTVESIYLNREMSRVFVRARMRRSVADHLTADAKFWIVRPRVGVAGISGLSTLVSGAYIEMYPGRADGPTQHAFVGLDEPPAMTPDTPGRSFTLHAGDLGSLTGGSPVSYRGVPVGEIEGFQLDPAGKEIGIYAFVRAPYDKYVNAQTRFWNSGGIDVAVGVGGLRFRASSWQQLISGGVSFDTPDSALAAPESAAGMKFQLYGNQYDAERDPRGSTLVYRVTFPGGGEVGPGTSVQLQSTEIGQVTESHLQFDDATDTFITRVTFQIDPSHVEIVNRRNDSAGDAAQALGVRLDKLVARGLRAHLVSANFLTGGKIVALDMMPEAPRARIGHVDSIAEFPAAGSVDLSTLLLSAQNILHRIDAATAGPALGHAIGELDRTLGNLERASAELEPQIKPLMASLRLTAEAAEHTLQAANNVLGNGASNGADLPRLIRELTDSARALRDLADYLERHPESLIRGRHREKP